MRTHGIAPLCVDCSTEGGAQARAEVAPWRCRGLCRNCYWRHYRRGTLRNYRDMDEHDPVVILAYPYSDAQRLRVLTCDHFGHRQRHALPFAPDYDRAAVIAEAEAFAARWLREHPAYVAKWCADEARAA